MDAIKNLVAKKYEDLHFPSATSYLLAEIDNSKYKVLAKHQADLVHASASMIKVLILDCLVSQSADLHQKVKFVPKDIVEGGGALQEFTHGGEISLATLARLMITLSDNTATNLLIDYLTMGKINDHAKALGLANTILQRKMMDFAAAKEGKENLMTVGDYMILLHHIYSHRQAKNYKFAYETMARQQFRDCLPGLWPEERIFHHKTGELDNLVHDGGIFHCRGKDYALICFCSQGEHNFITKYKMAKMGYEIYKLLSNS